MKTILITGANKGIGFETAKQLAELGHFIHIGSRDLINGQNAADKLKKIGLENVSALEIDVTDQASVKRAKEYLQSKGGVLDILINNAGIAGEANQHFQDGDIKTLKNIFDTNFFGTVQTTQAFVPLLKISPEASIINVSSEVGSLAIHSAERNTNRSNYHMYGSSKTALNAFTVMLANELYDEHICVNSVTPGYTATDLNNFQGLRSVSEGAKSIVDVALLKDRSLTGKFFKDGGTVEW